MTISRDSSIEWSSSSKTRANPSRNTVAASSHETLCFRCWLSLRERPIRIVAPLPVLNVCSCERAEQFCSANVIARKRFLAWIPTLVRKGGGPLAASGPPPYRSSPTDYRLLALGALEKPPLLLR